MRDDDDLVELVALLDPARSHEPPTPGSPRHTSILEKAMSTTTDPLHAEPADNGASTPASRPRRPARRWFYAAAAAAVATVAVGTGVLRPGNERSAEATLAAAADQLAGVHSLRGEMHFDNTLFGETDITIAMSGLDTDSTWEITGDGGPPQTQRFVMIDGTQYATDPTGQTTVQPMGSYLEEEGGSFAESSSAVLNAVLEDSEVDEVGTEEVQGVEATRYRLELPDARRSALAALPDQQLDWFGLIIGDPGLGEDVTVDVWVADDLVLRFDISSPSYGSQSVEFHDFNTDVTITPPPGPYTELPTN